jgi:hypothetical protein
LPFPVAGSAHGVNANNRYVGHLIQTDGGIEGTNLVARIDAGGTSISLREGPDFLQDEAFENTANFYIQMSYLAAA